MNTEVSQNMDVSFNGIGDKLVTFLSKGAKKGQVVKVSGEGAVAPCAAGDAFDGLAVLADDGFAGVQLRGFADVSYSEGEPKVGHNKFAADGRGGVKTDESNGKDYLTVAVDAVNHVATILMSGGFTDYGLQIQ